MLSHDACIHAFLERNPELRSPVLQLLYLGARSRFDREELPLIWSVSEETAGEWLEVLLAFGLLVHNEDETLVLPLAYSTAVLHLLMDSGESQEEINRILRTWLRDAFEQRDATTLAWAFAETSLVALRVGNVVRGIAALRARLRLVSRIGDVEAEQSTAWELGTLMIALERHEEAQQHLERAVAVARSRDEDQAAQLAKEMYELLGGPGAESS